MYVEEGKKPVGNSIIYSKSATAEEERGTFAQVLNVYGKDLNYFRHTGNFSISILEGIQIGNESMNGSEFISRYVDKDGRITNADAADALQISLKNHYDNQIRK